MVVAVVLVGAAGVSLFLIGNGLISSRNHSLVTTPGNLTAQAVHFASGSGAEIQGWLVPGLPEKGAVILIHGFRSDRLSMRGRAWFLNQAGYTVLLFDFQVHGESLGKHITFGYLESRDVAAAVDFIHREYPDKKMGIIGVSMGGAAALLAQPPVKVNALVLESVYPDIQHAVEDRLTARFGYIGKWGVPWLTWQLRPRLGIRVDELSPIQKVSRITVPKLIVAGTADRLTHIEEARELFAAAEPKEF